MHSLLIVWLKFHQVKMYFKKDKWNVAEDQGCKLFIENTFWTEHIQFIYRDINKVMTPVF